MSVHRQVNPIHEGRKKSLQKELDKLTHRFRPLHWGLAYVFRFSCFSSSVIRSPNHLFFLSEWCRIYQEGLLPTVNLSLDMPFNGWQKKMRAENAFSCRNTGLHSVICSVKTGT
jgi:hypothetical protein